MNAGPWLVADAKDWSSIVLFALIFFFFVLAPLLSRLAEAQAKAARRARPRPPQPGGPKPNDPLADEIAEFLRRASQQQRPETPARPAANLVEAARLDAGGPREFDWFPGPQEGGNNRDG